MTDLEATRLCAEAMGWKHLGAVGIVPYRKGLPDDAFWCMSNGNDWWLDPEGNRVCAPCQGIPDPLTDDAQAMALVKRLGLRIDRSRGIPEQWGVSKARNYSDTSFDVDLNRAIVYCVATLRRSSNSTGD